MKNSQIKLLKLFSTVLLFALFAISGCSSDDTDNPDNPDVNTLTANAGPDQSVLQGAEVQLDGSASSHSAGESFNYSWKFSSSPTTSSSLLTGANTSTPSFTPDVVGDYIIELKVSNATIEDTDTIKITVTQSGTTGTQELGGDITEDIVLTNLIDTPGVADYCVTSNVNLQALMTIEPGVEIHFEADLYFKVGDKGVIIAKGSPDKHIVFTAKNQMNSWRGIGIVLSDDVRNVMDYVDISYAGSDIISIADRKAGLVLTSFSKLRFTNSSVTNSQSIGMFLEDDAELIEFANNRFENNAERPLVLPASEVGKLDVASQFSLSNGDNSIEIHDGDVNLDTPTTWQSFVDDTPYYVTDNIEVDSELNIMPGAVFMFAADLSFKLGDLGILIAKGTAEDMIRFTARDQTQPWRGIGVVLSSSIRNAMDYVEISYAGLDVISIIDKKAALGISSFSKLSFTNSIITNSASNGMFIEDDVDIENFENNTFENNTATPLIISANSLHQLDTQSQFGDTNGNNYIEVLGGNINYDVDITWNVFEDNTPYVLSGDLEFQSGVTIAPKTKFMIQSDLGIIIRQSGFLSAKGGSADSRIVFTAFDTALPWRGIAFMTDNIRNEIDFAEVSYAGSDILSILPQKANIGVNSFDQLKVTNTIINNGAAYGIVVSTDSQVNIDIESNNTFSNNALGTVFFEN